MSAFPPFRHLPSDHELGACATRCSLLETMSTKRKAPSGTTGASTKRARVGETSATGSTKFQSAGDIRRALQSQSQEELRECTPVILIRQHLLTYPIALLSLRNQFSFKADETVAPQDARLILAKAWLDGSAGADDIFNVWEMSIRVSLVRIPRV